MTAHKCFLCVPEAKKSHICFNQVTHACVHFHYAMPSRNPVHTAYSQHKIVTKITLKSVCTTFWESTVWDLLTADSGPHYNKRYCFCQKQPFQEQKVKWKHKIFNFQTTDANSKFAKWSPSPLQVATEWEKRKQFHLNGFFPTFHNTEMNKHF